MINFTDSLIEEYTLDESEKIGASNDLQATDSTYEMANFLRSTGRPVKIVYDASIKKYFFAYGDLNYIHNNLIKAAIEYGFYEGYDRKTRNACFVKLLQGGTISFMRWAPKELVNNGYEDTEEDMYSYRVDTPLGVLSVRENDNWTSDVYLPVADNPLIKVISGWRK